jgi:hypothetical protein
MREIAPGGGRLAASTPILGPAALRPTGTVSSGKETGKNVTQRLARASRRVAFEARFFQDRAPLKGSDADVLGRAVNTSKPIPTGQAHDEWVDRPARCTRTCACRPMQVEGRRDVEWRWVHSVPDVSR